MDLYATGKTFVIKAGPNFNKLIPSSATSVEFSDEIMPASTPLIDVDADGDGSVVAWMDGTVMIVSSQIPGQNVIAAHMVKCSAWRQLVNSDAEPGRDTPVTD